MERDQLTLFEDNAEYNGFVEKFKPKRTTDDCYTPPEVYDAAAEWCAAEYGVDRASFVRPFYPELDFLRFEYPKGCTVVDNPPFSLLATIIRHYCKTGIRFFLFAPTMTLFTAAEQPVCYLPTGVDVTYENGAVVKTSFVTNLDQMRLRTVPELRAAVKAANEKAQATNRPKALPKYVYPPEVLTAAAAYQISERGIALDIPPEEAIYIGAMDAQRARGKSIFGGGLLLAERVAAERVAAERAAVNVWELSERERALLAGMEGQANGASLF